MNIFTKDDMHLIRKGICMSCDRLNKTLKVCTSCGCFIPAKVHLAMATCPLDKWPKIEIPIGEN